MLESLKHSSNNATALATDCFETDVSGDVVSDTAQSLKGDPLVFAKGIE